MRNQPWTHGLLAAALVAPAYAQHADHGTAVAPEPAEQTERGPTSDDHAAHMQHAEHAVPTHSPLPLVTEEARVEAFPDLSGMRVDGMMLEDPRNRLVLFDRLEGRDADGNPLAWDFNAWFGRTLGKLWIRSEGERRDNDTGHAELEVLWGKGFARWWDYVAGARRDFEPDPTQTWAAFGVRGLAPYRFDVEATAYLADDGDTAFRFTSDYQILVTNRLILSPLIELNWYGQTDPTRRIGAGLATGELGLRLRYEVRREVAPYIGIVRARRFGRTAELVGDAGDDTRLVMGVRLWF